jgi:predicted nucleic acid-binding protein
VSSHACCLLRELTLDDARDHCLVDTDVNDSWIAACCLARQLPLATLNIKDFSDYAEHEGLELVR